MARRGAPSFDEFEQVRQFCGHCGALLLALDIVRSCKALRQAVHGKQRGSYL